MPSIPACPIFPPSVRIYMAMISANVGEIALVQVENADDVQAVKDIFQAESTIR